jgi:hypothetical protein
MPESVAAMEQVASQVRAALEAADLSSFSGLLDPAVRWGAPDDSSPSCQNRAQVLRWYERGREAGVRAQVSETAVAGDRILVGLRVSGRAAPGGQEAAGPGSEAERWQVLTVRGGRIVDITGFDDRREAAARAGLTAGPGPAPGERA